MRTLLTTLLLCCAMPMAFGQGKAAKAKPATAAPEAPVVQVATPGPKAAYEMERYGGGSMKTELGYGIVLNKTSNLNREWFVIRDPAAPMTLVQGSGIQVHYESGKGRYENGDYRYKVYCEAKANEPVTAFELRVHVLDIFGRHLKTLTSTHVEDLSTSTTLNPSWRIWSEHEASEAFASVTYIARVRTASGRVYEADPTAVLAHVRKVAKSITAADLEPKREEPKK